MNKAAEHITRMQQRANGEQWKAIDKERQRLERPIIAEMEIIFDEQRREALERLEETRKAIHTQERARILSVDFIFNLAKWVRDTAARLAPWILAALESGYAVGGAQMGEDLPDLTSNDPDVRDSINTLLAKTSNISRTTQTELAKIVEAALQGGKDVDTVAGEIAQLFDDFKSHRPKTIAQTSITAGFSAGQDASFGRIGYEKRWLSQRDGHVRDTHFKADGQIVGPRDRFLVGLAQLRFPGDPETERIEEIINCRCAMLPGKKVS